MVFPNESRVISSEISQDKIQEKVVKINRNAKVVKGGRRFSFSAIVVVGDGEGVVGFGLGKANEVTDAIAKGIDDAKKNLVRVGVLNGTIPHETVSKYNAAKILLKPAAPGTGVLAGGAMRAVLEAAGVKDVIGKNLGSSNPHNVVKATIKALAFMNMPHHVAKRRTIPLGQVFNGKAE
ncbi:MAG: 30S ribosomal protein S5 [Bacteroidia bacterium]|nr:30S ribosomal protein S5 [Bacteroidia bacterium]